MTRVKYPSVYFWLLAPAMAVSLGLIVYPLLRAIAMSLTDLGIAGAARWIGAENYTRLFHDPLFWNSLRVTLTFIAVGLVVEVLLGGFFALLLEHTVSHMNKALRVVFTVPMMICPVVIGITWRALLNPQFGWVNAILGTPGTDWIGNPDRALWVLIGVDIWQWTPFLFMLISAGLLAIPEEVKEAARLDGANAIRLLRHIKFPLMLPTLLVAILLRTLDATKTFDVPYTLTSGGPGTRTQTLAIFLYKNAFANFEQGYASAIAITITVALTSFALLYIAMMRRAERRFV